MDTQVYKCSKFNQSRDLFQSTVENIFFIFQFSFMTQNNISFFSLSSVCTLFNQNVVYLCTAGALWLHPVLYKEHLGKSYTQFMVGRVLGKVCHHLDTIMALYRLTLLNKQISTFIWQSRSSCLLYWAGVVVYYIEQKLLFIILSRSCCLLYWAGVVVYYSELCFKSIQYISFTITILIIKSTN